jgi:hypothetical protein
MNMTNKQLWHPKESSSHTITLKEPVWHALFRFAAWQPAMLLLAWCCALPVAMTHIATISDLTVGFWCALMCSTTNRKMLLVDQRGISEIEVPWCVWTPKRGYPSRLLAPASEIKRVTNHKTWYGRAVRFEIAYRRRDIKFAYRSADRTEDLSRKIIELTSQRAIW